MARSEKPRRLGEVIESLVDRLGIRDELGEAEIIETWAVLAGAEINAVTDSAWMKGGTLFVKISSSTWRHRLHMDRSSWRSRLNLELGKKAVDEVVFR